MNKENDLMNKLVVAKKIMDVHNQTPRAGNNGGMLSSPMLEQFNAPPATYNIPQEFMGEQSQPMMSSPTTPPQLPTKDRILNSKLPDEIKKLMMENPIAQPLQQNVTISDDLIERASRLMKQQGSYVPDSAKPKTAQPQQSSNTSQVDYKLIKKMISEAINEALTENGLMVESTEKSNEMFTFRVGKHIFEGKVTKIKKVS